MERYAEDKDSQNTEYLVESLGNHNYPIQVASTSVDIRDQVTNKVRVLNPYPDLAIISQNSVIQLLAEQNRSWAQQQGCLRQKLVANIKIM